MSSKYDIVLKNGTIVDYLTNVHQIADIAIRDNRIAEIAPALDGSLAKELFDVTGQIIVPGLIDLHVHASGWLGGQYAHKMLALQGVTTALDMAGPVDSVLDIAASCGTGLNLATLEYVRPGHTVASSNPSVAELEELMEKTLTKGGLGIKLLGGHYPLTNAATRQAIEIANRHKAYVAFHAGTENSASDLNGFLEAVTLAKGCSLHVAHINSYCRGAIKSCNEETAAAIAALIDNPNITAESYLSPFNGTSAKCTNSQPDSLVTRKCLLAGGFAPTEQGMTDAILAGWAHINMPLGGKMVLAHGQQALHYWQQHATDTTVSFSVNPAEARIALAGAKRPNGAFVIDCISTDGGGIPRNVIAEMGLSLVRLQVITLKEFVQKTSYNAAQILGLPNKGHLSPGADADITVLDADRHQAVLTIANGQVIMHKGYVCGSGCNIITTQRGCQQIAARGLQPIVVDLAQSKFYKHS